MASRRQPFHYNSSGGASANGFPGGSSSSGFAGMEVNDDLIEGLVPKVSVLKSLALDMGDEIKSQNSLLSSMDHDTRHAACRLYSKQQRSWESNKIQKHCLGYRLLSKSQLKRSGGTSCWGPSRDRGSADME